jgi:hypothetical protein
MPEIILCLLVFALCGCSKSSQPPTEFSKRISTADRIVATNNYYALGLDMSGADVSNLTRAIASAHKKTAGTDLDWSNPFIWNLKFFAETNQLAVIPTGYGEFSIEGISYRDGTGIMEALWKKLEADRTR